MPHYKLHYFDICGRAEPIRMMFSVAGVPYEDHRFTKAEWPELKKNFPFEAVPVLEVDGVQVAQTLAILRYVARENGFAGPDNLTAAIADSLADQFVDFLTSTEKWLSSCFNDGPPKGDEVMKDILRETTEEIYKTVYVPERSTSPTSRRLSRSRRLIGTRELPSRLTQISSSLNSSSSWANWTRTQRNYSTDSRLWRHSTRSSSLFLLSRSTSRRDLKDLTEHCIYFFEPVSYMHTISS
ncbi:hypothetical protein PMAYCL1PPCAC_00694 [Pristionchus mayeri]|uniref:GST N-terminal domain-containing protein n=1 Tax=Pristionchus mayeri TaxID=1317129 RepID=A0AAN5C696_9BILA|nr:hypothetical protein PMAYCL1PPCAC_00694 [Pristionchus mayeri]